MSNNKIAGLALVSFIASVLGIIISYLLLKEDVASTAHTVFEYFPERYGVIPSSTWGGAVVLGYFTSIAQIITASVAFSNSFSKKNRISAGLVFVGSCIFDNWTDVVFRSGNLTGNVGIATVTTFAFYTFGSEVLQGFSWLVFFSMWRKAISDSMWGIAMLKAGILSIKGEWRRFDSAASRKETKDRGSTYQDSPSPSSHQQSVSRTTQSPKPSFFGNRNQTKAKPDYTNFMLGEDLSKRRES